MNHNQSRTKFMILMTMLVSLQIVLMITPLGFILIGPLRITTLHILTILAGVLFGPKAGAILGLTFGLGSVIVNTLNPTPMSFLFSPFAPPLGEYHGNIWSLVIALAPRVLLGVISAITYRMIKSQTVGSIITALIGTLLHTLMVISLIYTFFGAGALGESGSRLLTILIGVILSNGLIEAGLAAVVVTALVKVLEPMSKKVM